MNYPIHKKRIAGAAAACLLLACSLSACGSKDAVYVQSVATLSGSAYTAGDRFMGLVVSEKVVEINKDSDKSIAELCVSEGDEVNEGDVLFTYDTDSLKLTLEKQVLEKEQLERTIESSESQIAVLEQSQQWASAHDKLEYSVQIQTAELDKKEAEINLKTKENEIARSESILENADVTSPIKGRIQSISESGTDSSGNAQAYITIQQTGSYRIKGVLNELQRGALMEGDRVKIFSRTNEELVWYGTVTLVDYDNPTQGSSTSSYYGSSADEMSSSSRYPFYVQPESLDGLVLGQHLYMEADSEDSGSGAVEISDAYICWNEDGTAYVWACGSNNKLEKRTVETGAYNDIRGTIEILSGLTNDDYVAFPDEELCKAGASVTHTAPKTESTESAEQEAG